MKSTLNLCLIFLVGMLPAQTNLTGSSQKSVSAGYTAKNGGTIETGMLALTGLKVATTDSVTTCRGECEMTVHGVLLKADEMDFHPNTGEVEARGNVRVKLLPLGAPNPQAQKP